MWRRFHCLYPTRDTVTLRERDSMKQERVKISDLVQLLSQRIA